MLLVPLLPGIRPLRAAEDEPIGFVMDIGGVWKVDGEATKLSGGAKLPGGAVLVPLPSGSKSFITICYYSGDAETYTARATLRKQVESGWTSRLWSVVQGHFRGGIVHAVSRGDGVDDGVARLDGEQLQLAHLLKHLPAGRHLLRFSSIKGGQTDSTEQPITLTIDWNPAGPAEIAACGLSPGLYQVQLLDKRSKRPTGAQATVLVARGEAFATASDAFAEAVAATSKWDESTRSKVAAPFLSAYLEALAEGHDQ
jgi:hypothetical protein